MRRDLKDRLDEETKKERIRRYSLAAIVPYGVITDADGVSGRDAAQDGVTAQDGGTGSGFHSCIHAARTGYRIELGHVPRGRRSPC